MTALNILKTNSYKIGLNEVKGLEAVLREVMNPIVAALKKHVYWDDLELNSTEYLRRDGFIPYASNCGGLEISEIIPESESSSFRFLTFGEWDGEHYCDGTDKDNCDCIYGNDGEYDAALRIWLKFEGIDNDGNMNFYLCLSGGNEDAPYFRTSKQGTLFETDFSAKTLNQVKLNSKKHITKLLKFMKGEK